MAPTSIIVAHGGEWSDDNKYEGGRRERIPLPSGGISFKNLVAKIELRLMKPRNLYVYEIDALTNDSTDNGCTDELMRTKITDDFELSFVMGSASKPVLFVTTTPINVELSSLLLHQNIFSQKPVADKTIPSLDKYAVADKTFLTLDKDPVANKTIPSLDNDYFNDDDDPNFHGDDFIREDFHDEDFDDEDVGTHEENRGSNNQNVSPAESTRDSVQESSDDVRQWTIPGASFHSSVPTEDLGSAIIEADDYTVDTIAVGVIFNSKANMIASVGLYHLVNHLEFFTKKSSPQRYVIVCKHNRDVCPFILRANAVGKAWVVDVWLTHTCEKDLRYHADPTVFSKVLASYFVPNLMVEGVVLRPRDIQAQVQRLFGAKIKYATALSARNQALTMTYGDSNKSFQKLPSYLYMLKQSNPGSVVDLKTDEDGAFEYCFMALAASIRGFKACRPVIVVDGTHLKGKYNGIMFVAATKDANEQIFPLAFGFGAKECDESWIWFLKQCRRTFGSPENLLIVSDQHISIKNALDVVYPGIPHGICVYHLQGNIKWWGDKAILMFQAAANAYRYHNFEERMNNLKAFAPAAYDKLMAADPVRWARSKYPVPRYRFLTSNCAECLNGRLRWARKLPVCTLLECVRTMIRQWFAERREQAMNRTQELTAFAEVRLARAAELAHKMTTESISPTKYKVTSSTKHHIVDIESRKCTCLVYDLDLIPCSHAAAAICQSKQSAVAYVSDCYTTQTLREIYAGEVMPIPIPEDWCVPDEVSLRIVGTPVNPKQAGRPVRIE